MLAEIEKLIGSHPPGSPMDRLLLALSRWPRQEDCRDISEYQSKVSVLRRELNLDDPRFSASPQERLISRALFALQESRSLYWYGDYNGAFAILSEHIPFFSHFDDAPLQFRAYNLLVNLLIRLGNVAEAEQHFSLLSKLANSAGVNQQASLGLTTGIFEMAVGRPEKAIPVITNALGILEKENAPDELVRLYLHQELGSALFFIGKMHEALPHFAVAIRSHKVLGQSRSLVGALHNIAVCCMNLGLMELAYSYLTEALAQAQSLGAAALIAGVHLSTGSYWFDLGATDKAQEQLDLAQVFFSKVGLKAGMAQTKVLLALVAERHAALGDAVTLLTEALVLAKNSGNPVLITRIEAELERISVRMETNPQVLQRYCLAVEKWRHNADVPVNAEQILREVIDRAEALGNDEIALACYPEYLRLKSERLNSARSNLKLGYDAVITIGLQEQREFLELELAELRREFRDTVERRDMLLHELDTINQQLVETNSVLHQTSQDLIERTKEIELFTRRQSSDIDHHSSLRRLVSQRIRTPLGSIIVTSQAAKENAHPGVSDLYATLILMSQNVLKEISTFFDQSSRDPGSTANDGGTASLFATIASLVPSNTLPDGRRLGFRTEARADLNTDCFVRVNDNALRQVIGAVIRFLFDSTGGESVGVWLDRTASPDRGSVTLTFNTVGQPPGPDSKFWGDVILDETVANKFAKGVAISVDRWLEELQPVAALVPLHRLAVHSTDGAMHVTLTFEKEW